MARRIVIKGGIAAGFADELDLPLTNMVTQRVSSIVPRAAPLRVLFAVIRAVVSEDGGVANWTRSWTCEWVVKIDRETHGPFNDRQKAIVCEKSLIQESGVVDRFLQAGISK